MVQSWIEKHSLKFGDYFPKELRRKEVIENNWEIHDLLAESFGTSFV